MSKMTFTFSEDKVKKGSEPIKTGVYDVLLDGVYFTEEKSDRGEYLRLHIAATDIETERKISFEGFGALYAGTRDGDKWTFMNPKKDGKDLTPSGAVETLNQLSFLITGKAYAPEDLQDGLVLTKGKAKDYKGKEIHCFYASDLSGKAISLVVKRFKDGYVKNKEEWVDTERVRLENVISSDDRKTAFETSENREATYEKEYLAMFDEDYVEPLYGKMKEEREKWVGVGGGNTSSSGDSAPAGNTMSAADIANVL